MKTICSGEVVAIVLVDVFTEGERRLADSGSLEEVRSGRRAIGDQLVPILRTLIEGATGRSVEAALSQISRDGVASEVFLLG